MGWERTILRRVDEPQEPGCSGLGDVEGGVAESADREPRLRGQRTGRLQPPGRVVTFHENAAAGFAADPRFPGVVGGLDRKSVV